MLKCIVGLFYLSSRCKYWSYPINLPKASIIIVFLNEPWTTFIRTIHNIINTSPSHLLQEIILVDDFSTDGKLKIIYYFAEIIVFLLEDLQERLENYIKKFHGLVKLYRNKKHEGLIKTRMNGIKKAKGEVVVILDAHVECVNNWLPPLLVAIAIDRFICRFKI